MGRKLFNQAGRGFGGEADADPVGPGADVDAGGVRMLDGQSLDVGSLLLAKGFALALRPGFTAVIGLALGLGRAGCWEEGRKGAYLGP
jgi:hypothetical protein